MGKNNSIILVEFYFFLLSTHHVLLIPRGQKSSKIADKFVRSLQLPAEYSRLHLPSKWANQSSFLLQLPWILRPKNGGYQRSWWTLVDIREVWPIERCVGPPSAQPRVPASLLMLNPDQRRPHFNFWGDGHQEKIAIPGTSLGNFGNRSPRKRDGQLCAP